MTNTTLTTIIAGLVVLAFVVGSMMTGSMVYAAPNGQPFQALWDAIDELQIQIDLLSSQNSHLMLFTFGHIDPHIPVYQGCGGGSFSPFVPECVMPTSGTITDLTGSMSNTLGSTSPGIGNTVTFTLFVDGVPTPVSCEISDLQTNCSDSLNSIQVQQFSTTVVQVSSNTDIGPNFAHSSALLTSSSTASR